MAGPAGAAHLIRYEDLIQRPLEVLPEILDYLGLDGGVEAAEKMPAAAAVETPELRNHRTTPMQRPPFGAGAAISALNCRRSASGSWETC